jgi:hypothetical protein
MASISILAPTLAAFFHLLDGHVDHLELGLGVGQVARG